MSNLVKWDPFAELSALQKQFFGDDWTSPLKAVNIPTTDIYTVDDSLIVEAHLPNFERKDVNIEVDGGALIVSAERHEREQDKDRKFVLRESSNSFYRRIALPKRVDTESIEAHLDDGVLKVKINMTPLPEPKKISVGSKKK